MMRSRASTPEKVRVLNFLSLVRSLIHLSFCLSIDFYSHTASQSATSPQPPPLPIHREYILFLTIKCLLYVFVRDTCTYTLTWKKVAHSKETRFVICSFRTTKQLYRVLNFPQLRESKPQKRLKKNTHTHSLTTWRALLNCENSFYFLFFWK